VGSQEALRSLLDGRCTVAGFHVPQFSNASPVFMSALRPLLQPGLHKLIGSHRRQQGLILRKNVGAQASLRDIIDAKLRFVNRQQGSGTRLLLDHLLDESHVRPEQVDGYYTRIEHTHVAVAATIAAGAADAGLGVEAAAREFGLDFLPLVDEDYFLVCLKTTLDAQPVVRLREVLASSAWAAALSSLAGCTPARSGEVLSLTKALPWWRFKTARATRGAVVQSNS
jgi:putative molybdopterin biosynthesis protein